MGQLRGPLGRLRNAALWKVAEFDLNRRFLADLNAMRTEAGTSPLKTISDLWRRPPRLLYMTLPSLDYPRSSWPESFRFIGPSGWEPNGSLPTWLEEIERPLVLVTASTEYQNDEALIETALAALADEDITVIATTGGTDPAHFHPPTNARVERFVPHGPVLQKADTVICHGGMGIVQKSLGAGVPLCIVGWGRDQLESGRRIEAAGAGVLLKRKQLNPRRLRDAYHRAREKRDGARRVAADIAASHGPKAGADELEAMLN